MTKEKILKTLKSIYFSFAWLTVLLFALDLISKWVVQNTFLVDGKGVTVISNFFDIRLSHNMGAAFSLGDSGSPAMRTLWIIVSVVMSVGLIFYYVKNYKKLNVWYRLSLSMMIAGALGNMIDRMFYWDAIVGFDGVIDWLSFTLFGDWKFPSFNIADSALVVGVIIIIVILIVELIQDSIKKGKKGAYALPPKEYEKKIEEEQNHHNDDDKTNKA